MRRRILLADAPEPLAADARRGLEAYGCEVELAGPAEAVERAAAGRYDAAVVGASERAAGVAAAMRAADPLLPILVLAPDAVAAAGAAATVEDADGVAVAPLDGATLGALCALAARVREGAERLGELEGILARRETGSRDLGFLKKLLFVEVKRSKRYGYPLSLALLEVDGWAGSAAPEPAARTAILARLLGAVTRAVRDIDVAVPLSGERLVVLMPHTAAEGALKVARRLCEVVREHEAHPRLTASVGVASHGGDRAVSFGALVRRAGEALGRARAAGGDRAEAADPPSRRDRISIG